MASFYTLTFTHDSSELVLQPYTINGTINPYDATNYSDDVRSALQANTSLILFGKGVPEYGTFLQQNLINLLQNFVNPQEPVTPVVGQAWYDTAANTLKVYDGDSFLATTDSLELGGLSDVAISGLTSSDYFTYNGTKWTNSALPSNLADIAALSPGNNNTLVHRTSGWVTKSPIQMRTMLSVYAQATCNSLFVNVAGDTMTGELSMGSNKIVDVTDPDDPQDVATKAYVDSTVGGGGAAHLAGTETFTGDKTFSGVVDCTGTFIIPRKSDPGSPVVGEFWINSSVVEYFDSGGIPAARILVATDVAQTLTQKTLDSTTNTIRATKLATTGAPVVINGAAPPAAGRALVATSATTATWQDVATQTELNTHAALTITHGVSGSLIGTTDTQTLTNKTIDDATNTVRASSLATTGAAVVISGAAPPSTAGQALVTTSATVATWQDIATEAELTTHAALTTTHGVSGALVGTTDTQTLTSKTFTGTTVFDSLAPRARSITADRTLDATDFTIFADATSAAITVTLPATSGTTGRIYIIKKTDNTNNVTVDANASETIDGATTYVLNTQYQTVRIQSSGTEWFIV